MSTASNFLMLGLRGSGKTTFLAALWHYLESAEHSDRLALPLLQPDRDYLNRIRNSWLAMKPVGRTSSRANATVSLALHDNLTNSDINILIPDLWGELFRLQWSTRKAPTSYVSFAKECTGVMLFIHPHEVRKTHAIKRAAPNDDGKVELDEPSPRIPSAGNWSPEQSSTQVQLVDILQLLLRIREAAVPIRIAVVISAWDVVKARNSPAGWLGSRLPLLSQFLRANQNSFASMIFGVSAQGGDLIEDRDRLLQSAIASSRCLALEGETIEPVSITSPLSFLLSDTQQPELR